MTTELWTESELASIHRILHPRSVAVVGATERLHYGGRVMRGILHARDRVRIYPVNPRHEEVFGLTCYPTVSALPEVPDLTCVVVPSEHVMEVLEDSQGKGVKAGVIVSAGFAERGAAGLEAQRQLGAFCRESGLRCVGPNINGVVNVKDRIWLSSAGVERINPKSGNVGLISQSGATASTLLQKSIDAGVGFTYAVSTGNEADLEFSDIGRYLLDDPDTRVIAGFVEGLKDIPKFVELAKLAAERGKPIVVLKLGRTEIGRRAATTHTGSLTGKDAVYEALFAQYGVTRVRDHDELLQMAQLLANAPKPPRPGVAVVSHSGGVTSLTADMCGDAGLPVPPLSEKGAAVLGAIMKDFGASNNPADISGHTTGDDFTSILECMIGEEEVGTLVVASAGPDDQANRFIKLRGSTPKAAVFMWTGTRTDTAGLPTLKAASVPLFFSPDKVGRGIKALQRYHAWRERHLRDGFAASPLMTAAQEQAAAALLTRAGGALSEFESKELLSAWGVSRTREQRASSVDAAIDAAQSVGFPVVLKVDSPDILHKTELGVVRLGLRNTDDVRSAYGEVLANAAANAPGAAINGVLVQEMVTNGVEAIVGVSYDEHIGPVLLFGTGGVFVEVFNDVALRRCPIDQIEAQEMISQVKGTRLLQGFRGSPPADVDALASALVSVSHLAVHLEGQLAELDVNPLMVLPAGQGVKAVDALLVLQTLAG